LQAFAKNIKKSCKTGKIKKQMLGFYSDNPELGSDTTFLSSEFVIARPRSVWPWPVFYFTYLYFMSERQSAIYIMANKYRGTLYTGVTSDLI